MFSIGAKQWAGISKLIEEAGEVIQVCGKLMGSNGKVAHWDGSQLDDRLCEELGDLLAAIEFVIEVNLPQHRDRITKQRMEDKLALFRSWHREQTLRKVR